MNARPLRVAIDARYLSHGLVGGVHTYLYNLAVALLQTDDRTEYTFWTDDKAPFELLDANPEARTRVLPWRTPLSTIRNDLRIGTAMRRDGADLIHFPANHGFAPPGAPAIVTLHDAINILPLTEIVRGHPKRPGAIATMTYLHLATSRTMRRNPFVITVSRHARREILRHADLDPDQVRVIYSAPDKLFGPVSDDRVAAERARLGVREHVLLADAIKNPRTTLSAYRRLPAELRDRASLIFFSRREPDPFVRDAARAGECLVVQRPTTEQLALLYNLADVFVFPSWYEGFGLPVIEAMACGAPAVASSAGSIPEIVGEAGIVVPDSNDSEAFASAVASLIRTPIRRLELRERSLKRAAGFSWQRTARETQEAYGDAITLARERARRGIHTRELHV